MGLAMAAILYPMYQPERVARSRAGTGPGLAASSRLLVGILLLVDLAMLTESPLVLYPVAVLSILGVLALLASFSASCGS